MWENLDLYIWRGSKPCGLSLCLSIIEDGSNFQIFFFFWGGGTEVLDEFDLVG